MPLVTDPTARPHRVPAGLALVSCPPFGLVPFSSPEKGEQASQHPVLPSVVILFRYPTYHADMPTSPFGTHATVPAPRTCHKPPHTPHTSATHGCHTRHSQQPHRSHTQRPASTHTRSQHLSYVRLPLPTSLILTAHFGHAALAVPSTSLRFTGHCCRGCPPSTTKEPCGPSNRT